MTVLKGILKNRNSSNVLVFNSVSDFPTIGNTNTLYVAEDTDSLYYWNGSTYVEFVSSDPVIDGEVDYYADLPPAASHSGETYYVKYWSISNPTKLSGLYISDGASWARRSDKVLYSLTAFTATDKIIVTADTDRQTKETPVGIDSSGNVTDVNSLKAKTSAGLSLYASNGTLIGDIGIGNTANNTWEGVQKLNNLTASSAVATDASKNLVSVTNTGSGNNVLATSPTFTTQITTPTVIKTGATDTNYNYSANSGSSITIDPANGKYQTITLTNNTTITLATNPSATTEREIILELKQDGTGGRTVAWSNITFATTGAVVPAINTAAGQSTYIGVTGTSVGWIGYAANQNLGVTDGSVAAAGYIGEVISSSVAIGSAISLTTATAANITSINLSAGDWEVSGNIGFIGAAGCIPTQLTASVSATTATQATSPNGGGFVQLAATLGTAATNVMAFAPTTINISTGATYYLVGTATFTGGTLTAYGSIKARRVR